MYFDQVHIVPATGRHAEQVPKDFFYSRVVEKNDDEFQKISPLDEFNNKLQELVREQKEQISKELDEFGEPVSTVAQDVLFPTEQIQIGMGSRFRGSDSVTTTKYTGDRTDNPVLLFILEEEVSWRRRRSDERSDRLRISLLAQDSDDGEAFLDFFGDEIYEISKYVGDYANVKELTSSGEIVRRYFDEKVENSSNLTGWYRDVEDDDFENEVFDRIQDSTGISMENVRIEVDVGDNPDFDAVALPLGGVGQGYAFEVKNYSQDKNDEVDVSPAEKKDSGELRSELIRKPKDYAEQADLQLVSVAKGLSDDQYENLRRLAESSNVMLLNEGNYKEKLNEVLFEQKFREMSDYVI